MRPALADIIASEQPTPPVGKIERILRSFDAADRARLEIILRDADGWGTPRLARVFTKMGEQVCQSSIARWRMDNGITRS